MIWSGLMSFLQQIIGLLFSIIIARKLTPADFGMVGMLTIFTAVATCLQDGGLVWALTNKKEVTKQQYSSVFWFNLFISLCLYVILFFCAPIIAKFFNQPELIWLSRYVFLGIIFASLSVVQTAYLFKKIRVKERAIATIVGLIVSGIIGVVLAYNEFSYWGIATQGILNIGITTLLLWFFSPFRPELELNWDFLKEIIPDGLRFVVPNIFTIAGENIFSVILGKKYIVSEVGNFTQASKWNTAGYSSILGMMRGVSQPVLVQVRDDKEKYLSIFRKLFRMAAFLIVPVMLGVSMVSTELIQIVLTEKWIDAAPILRILCIGGIFSVLNAMMTYFIMSLGRTTLYMYLGICMSIIQVIIAFVASYWGGVIALAYSYSTVMMMSFLIYYGFVRQTHPYSFRLICTDLLPIFFIALVSFVGTYFATICIKSIYLLLVSRIIIATSLYLIFMAIFKCDPFIEVLAFLRRFTK